MALFGNKTKKEKVEVSASVSKAKPATKVQKTKEAKAPSKAVAIVDRSTLGLADVILRPHVTEKSGALSQIGKYTFQVTKGANKQSIAKAIQVLYKVKPEHITVLNQPVKNVFVRGRRGTVAGIRKAVVTVKKGDKIDFV